jgi:hypothetical protein
MNTFRSIGVPLYLIRLPSGEPFLLGAIALPDGRRVVCSEHIAQQFTCPTANHTAGQAAAGQSAQIAGAIAAQPEG